MQGLYKREDQVLPAKFSSEKVRAGVLNRLKMKVF
jgi:hypothetical protein